MLEVQAGKRVQQAPGSEAAYLSCGTVILPYSAGGGTVLYSGFTKYMSTVRVRSTNSAALPIVRYPRSGDRVQNDMACYEVLSGYFFPLVNPIAAL